MSNKEYQMAIKIAGEVEKSFTNSMGLTKKELRNIAKQAALTSQSSMSMAQQFCSGVDAVSGGFGKLESFAKGTFEAVAKAATVTATAVGAVATASISVGSAFEAQMSTVKALSGATDAEFQELNEAAKRVGETTSFSATEAGQAMEYMAMAGWKTDQMLAGIDGIINLAAASGEELASVSDIVTDALTALGYTAEDTNSFVDILAATATSSNTDVAMLGEAFKYVASTAGTLDYTAEDLSVALGTMANSGVKGSQAGNALKTALARMAAPTTAVASAMDSLGISMTKDNGKTKSLMEVMENLRSSIGAVSVDFVDAEGNLREYDDIVADLAQSTEGLSQIQQIEAASTIFGKNAMAGMLTIVNATDEEFQSLTESVYNSTGAAEAMATIKLDNLQGDVTLFKSAMEGVGIEIYEQFNTPLREGVQAGTEYLDMLNKYLKNSGAVQKVTSNIVKALPTFIRQAKSAGGAALELMKPLLNIAEYMIAHPDVIAAGLAAIGGAIATYKVAEGIKSVINAFSGISAVMSNPVALGITATAAAIAGVAAIITKVKLKEKELKEENLAEHFGNITLSLEDLDQAAKHIIGADNLGQLSEMMSNVEGLEQYKTSMQSTLEDLNKLNWKVKIGMELDDSERSSYISSIDSYITDCLAYVEQNNYTVSLAMDIMAGDSDVGTQIKESTTQFYLSTYTELQNLGNDLKAVVNEAFQDDLLTIDEVEQIRKLQEQMAEIQNKLAVSEFDAKMETMNIKYGGGMLDADTFQNLQAELTENVEQVKADLEESLTISIAATKIQLDDGAINQAGYDAAVKELTENYYSQIGDIELKSANFQYDTIVQQYAEELNKLLPEMEGKTQEVLEKIVENVNTYGINEAKNIIGDADTLRAMMGLDEIDDTTVQALNDLFEQMEPVLQQMSETREKMLSAGMEVPEAYAEGIADLAALGAVADNATAIYTLVGEVASDSPEFTNTLKNWKDGGTKMPSEVIAGLRSKDAELEAAVKETYLKMSRWTQGYFSQGISVDIPLNLNINANAQGVYPPYATAAAMMAHAEGGIFSTPHVALFAEAGPEAVIPINNTQNAYDLWWQTGKLLGMEDELSLSEAATTEITNQTNSSMEGINITYAPNNEFNFYGGTPNQEDIAAAEKLSQEEFETMLEKYYKDKGRVRL